MKFTTHLALLGVIITFKACDFMLMDEFCYHDFHILLIICIMLISSPIIEKFIKESYSKEEENKAPPLQEQNIEETTKNYNLDGIYCNKTSIIIKKKN